MKKSTVAIISTASSLIALTGALYLVWQARAFETALQGNLAQQENVIKEERGIISAETPAIDDLEKAVAAYQQTITTELNTLGDSLNAAGEQITATTNAAEDALKTGTGSHTEDPGTNEGPDLAQLALALQAKTAEGEALWAQLNSRTP